MSTGRRMNDKVVAKFKFKVAKQKDSDVARRSWGLTNKAASSAVDQAPRPAGARTGDVRRSGRARRKVGESPRRWTSGTT
jgi:hypothetical protein